MLAEASVSVSAGRRLRRRRRRQALSQNGYGHKNYQKRRTATDGPGREGRGTGARGPHTAPPRTGRKRERSRNKPALRGAGEREGPPRGHRKPEGTSLKGTGGEGGSVSAPKTPREPTKPAGKRGRNHKKSPKAREEGDPRSKAAPHPHRRPSLWPQPRRNHNRRTKTKTTEAKTGRSGRSGIVSRAQTLQRDPKRARADAPLGAGAVRG